MFRVSGSGFIVAEDKHLGISGISDVQVLSIPEVSGALGHTPNASKVSFPRDLRTHILRLLGPKTILYKAFGLF